MRRHLTSVGLLIAGCLAVTAPLLLTSCGDDTQGVPFNSTGAGSGGVGAGGLGMSGGSAGTNGAGGGTSGSAAGGVAGSGGANGGGAAGTGGMAGAGGTGGASGASGNGGTGGNPVVRVYTIEGCDDVGAGGAGGAGAGGAGAGGADGAGGAADAGGADGIGGATDLGGASGEGGAGGPAPLPNLFASFTVYNFDTDQPVQTCVDKVADFSITITGDAPITVTANIAPGVGPASVIWIYDGVAQGAHNLFPYSLSPDDNGNFQEPTPPLAPGAHTLTMTAYDEMDGMGNVLGTLTIILTVIDGDA